MLGERGCFWNFFLSIFKLGITLLHTFQAENSKHQLFGLWLFHHFLARRQNEGIVEPQVESGKFLREFLEMTTKLQPV